MDLSVGQMTDTKIVDELTGKGLSLTKFTYERNGRKYYFKHAETNAMPQDVCITRKTQNCQKQKQIKALETKHKYVLPGNTF